MRMLILLAVTAALLCATDPARAQVATSVPIQSAGSSDWRYQWHNGQWWYYTPEQQWMYHAGGNWNAHHPAVENVNRGNANGQYRSYSYSPTYSGRSSRRSYSYSAGPGLAPMTGRNNSYSWPYTPFKKADSKVLGTNDY